MTLPELYEQQQRELEQFNAIRDKAWADLQKQQQEIIAAFGSRDNLPDDSRKRMDEQVTNYHKEWSTNGGQRHQELTEKHEQQRQSQTGKPVGKQEQLKPQSKDNKDQLTERQIELQKIIRQQQAIRERQQQKKRSR